MADEKTAAGPQAAPTAQPATQSDIAKVVDFQLIKDPDKRKIVQEYFEKTLTPEQQADLIRKNTKLNLEKMKVMMESVNSQSETLDSVVGKIIEMMQKDALERDLNEGYVDSMGQQKSYVEYYLSLVGSRNVSSNDIEKKYDPKVDGKSTLNIWWYTREPYDLCLNKVKGAARSVPLNVKREIRHQFVQEYVRALGETLDDFEAGWFDEFDLAEMPAMEAQFATKYPYLANFNAWLASKGMTLEGVTYQYSKLDMKAIADTSGKLENMKKSLSGYPKAQQDYYNEQISNINGIAINNPPQAADQIAALEKDMSSFTAFAGFGREIQGLGTKYDEFKGKYSDFDPKFRGQIDDLQKKFDDRMKQLDTEKDLQKRASIMDVASDLKKTKDQIEFDMIKASEDSAKKLDAAKPATPEAQQTADAAATAAPAEEDKPGFLDQAVLGDPKLKKIVTDLAKNVPLIGGFLLSAFFAPSTLRSLGISAPKDLGDFFKANGAPKTPEQLKVIEDKAKKILKDQFDIESTDELEIMAKTKIKDFLKKKPEKFDQKRYEKFVAALKKNGASDNEDKKVFEYVLLKTEEWKS